MNEDLKRQVLVKVEDAIALTSGRSAEEKKTQILLMDVARMIGGGKWKRNTGPRMFEEDITYTVPKD